GRSLRAVWDLPSIASIPAAPSSISGCRRPWSAHAAPAPLDDGAGERFRAGHELRHRYEFIRGVRDRRTAGTVHDGRDVGVAREESQIRAEGDAANRLAIAGDGGMALADRLDDRRIARRLAGLELTLEPLEPRRMHAKPRILLGVRAQSVREQRAAVRGILTREEAEASFGHEAVGHRGMPAASAHGADTDRRDVGRIGVERMPMRRVAVAVQLLDQREDGQERFDRAHAAWLHAGVRGPALERDPKRERAGLNGTERQLSRLHDDASVGTVPLDDGRQCTDAAGFFADHALENDVAGRLEADGLERTDSVESGRQPGFHVA